MFSAGRASGASAPAPTNEKARAWLQVGKTYQKDEDNDDEDGEGFTPVPHTRPKEKLAVRTPTLRVAEPKPAPKAPVVPSKVDKLYEMDRGRDKDNLFYGTLNAADVPRYHLYKRKREPEEDASLRYFAGKHAISAFSLQISRAQPPCLDDAFLTSSFIAIEPFKPIGDDDPDMLLESQRREARIVAQNKHFNTALRSDPSDVPRWIAYMNLQHDINEADSAKAKLKARAVALEKQVAIWARARTANPHSLVLAALEWRLSLQQPDNGDVVGGLERCVSAHPDAEDAWLLLLARKQMQFSAFSVAAQRDLFARVLQTLQMCPLEPREKGASLVHFASLLCRMEAASGYPERALSLLQALLDFNVTRPALDTDPAAAFAVPTSVEGSAQWRPQQPLPHALPEPTALPSMEEFVALVHARSEAQLEAMQPPLHLRDVPGHVAEESVGGEAAEDSSGDRSTEEGYVWSNVHGHR
ncbi:hypothetical protein ACHHYP_09828, partial [Achlya hypogyna]